MNRFLERTEIKFGFIIGFAVSFYVLIEYLLGLHTKYLEAGKYSGYISSLIPIIGLYLAIRTRRMQSPDKTISFKTAFMTGLTASLIASAIISGFFYYYNTKLNPGWMESALKEERTSMRKEGKNDKQINDEINKLKQIYSPEAQITGVFVGTALNGAILTLIIAALASRKKPQETTVQALETK